VAGAPAAALALPMSRPAQLGGRIRGFDHVALPMQNTEKMLAFYRGLGLSINENAAACSVYVGDQMINFHRPETWQRATFTLRAPAAKPPCGDLCFVWDGTTDSLKALLERVGATVIEGPVARQGGRKARREQCVCAGSRRQPSGIHDLLLRHIVLWFWTIISFRNFEGFL
jgi:catechol 2,3-dioxygenase-like lactoylglutathione lyase family enzyme